MATCKMSKKQQKAFDIALVNANFVAKEVAACQSICSEKVDEILSAMNAKNKSV